MESFSLLIVTGMSGAGKTKALQCLEDMGYFCIDNIPPVLIPKFTELCYQGGDKVSHVALVVDIRGGQFFDALSESLQSLDQMEVPYEILFIEASDTALVNRYKESRRSHPLASGGRVIQGIRKEKKLLAHIREKATHIVDTTCLQAPELHKYIKSHFSITSTRGMAITVVSFGFKYGIPMDADMVWDVRFLPNPFYIDAYRHKTGRVPQVSEYIHSFDITKTFTEKLFSMMSFLVPNYKQEGKSQVIIAIGCTGGMHRSVCMAEDLGNFLLEEGHNVTIEHRDMMKNKVDEDYDGTSHIYEEDQDDLIEEETATAEED